MVGLLTPSACMVFLAVRTVGDPNFLLLCKPHFDLAGKDIGYANANRRLANAGCLLFSTHTHTHKQTSEKPSVTPSHFGRGISFNFLRAGPQKPVAKTQF